MIKILAHGNQHLQAVCPKCGCFFEYGTEDIHAVQMYEPGKKSITNTIVWNEVRCPECNLGIKVGGQE